MNLKLLGVGILILFLVSLAAFVLQYRPMAPQTPPTSTQTQNAGLATTTLAIGSTNLIVEVASTEAEREQGLSDRTSLAPGRGMLFVFQQEQTPGFWMKDMSFALDMIWINAGGTVVSVTQDALPSSYNAADPNASQVFYPAAPVLYVLEVPAGFAAQNNIATGTVVKIGPL